MERVQHFVDIKAGDYWRAKTTTSVQDADPIPAGIVLLVESIKWVDDAPHTICLRAHPSVYSKYNSGYRLLVDEFISNFEPAPDYKVVRAAEYNAVQGKLSTLQQELQLLAANPVEMPTVEDVSDPTAEKISKIETSLSKVAVTAKEMSVSIQAKTDEIANTIQSMTPFYLEQAAASMAALENVIAHVKVITEGVSSLNLFVGKEVEITQLKKGESAPFHEPLTVYQSKLYMDEEYSVFAPVDADFDFHDEQNFLDALASNAGFVAQVFPSVRSVVCIATRRRSKDYGDRWTNYAFNQKNKEVFLLVRDGENLYKVWSPVESHLCANRLFPTKKEIDNIFKEWNEDITFNDVRYVDKLEEHDAVALHYKRFLILLAGLDQQHKLFGEFHSPLKGLEFISMDFQTKYMRFLYTDGSDLKQLVGSVMPSFEEFRSIHNVGLKPGSRVALLSGSLERRACPVLFGRSYHNQDTMVAHPVNRWGVYTTRQKGDDIVIDIPCERSYTRKPFTATAKITGDTAKRMLVLDRVKPSDLHYYIHNRSERVNHLAYIQLFKEAKQFLTTEEHEQAATRKDLRTKCRAAGVKEEDVESTVVEILAQYRVAHRSKSVPSPTDADYSKLTDFVSIVVRPKDYVASAETSARALGVEPLRLAKVGKNSYFLYTTTPIGDRDDWAIPHEWVIRHRLTGRDAKLKDSTPVYFKKRLNETIEHEWAMAEKWESAKHLFTSPKHKREVKTILDSASSVFLQAESIRSSWNDLLQQWISRRREESRGIVATIYGVVPIGIVTEKFNFLFLAAPMEDLLWECGNQKQRETLVQNYASIFRYATEAAQRMRENPYLHWSVLVAPDSKGDMHGFGHSDYRIHSSLLQPLSLDVCKEAMEDSRWRSSRGGLLWSDRAVQIIEEVAQSWKSL